jgi:hypothetical protein
MKKDVDVLFASNKSIMNELEPIKKFDEIY